jgi:ribosomal protein S18 acetylase RimI-like enzyme
MLLPPVEHISQITQDQQRQILQDHFSFCYRLFSEDTAFIPHSVSNLDLDCVESRELSRGSKSKFEAELGYNETQCYASCVPHAFFNAVFGNFPLKIPETCAYFAEKKLPFVWYVNEGENQAFEESLVKYGFHDAGIFRGVIGIIDPNIAEPLLPNNLSIVSINDGETMAEFNDLLCEFFGISVTAKLPLKKVLWELSSGENPTYYHWGIKKDGKIISILSTLIQNDRVSFWNGGTLPEFRKMGLSMALRQHALRHALSQGCQFGMSFLMSDGLAFGLCTKLGYQTQWRFKAFVSPTAE